MERLSFYAYAILVHVMNVLRSLKHRPFALLWSGQTISRLGDSFYRIALAWWVLEQTGSATAMGTVLVLTQIPLLIFLLIGGVVVDRFPRIRIMFISDVLSGLIITFIAVFSWLDMLEIWHIYVASLLFGFVEAFFFPAYQAVIPQITPPDMLTSANSLNGLSGRITGIVGPSIGAAMVVAGGTSLTFSLDALSFFVSALFVFPLLRGNFTETSGVAKASEAHGQRRSMKEVVRLGFGELRQGFNVIMAIPWIWVTILIYGFVNMSEASPRAVSLPFLIQDDLGADVALLGIFGSVFSVGFIVGAILLGQFKHLRRRGLMAYLTPLIQGILLLFFGFKFPVLVLIGSMFVYGFTFSVFGLIWNNTLQEMVPHEMLGRVYSIDALGSFVFLPIGFALAGWATDLIGAPAVFLIGGTSTIVLALLGLSHPAIRNLD
jgi:DHA3 family tetracycline resistance protein-like MFS transporter